MSNTESNGIAPTEKSLSALQALLKQIDSEKIKLNASDVKAVTADFKKAMGERAKLQAALDAFDAKTDETAVKMVKAYGKKHVVVDGVRYVPTSRGPRVYYKRMSDEHDTVEL
jgi:hypothetical protein